MVAYAYSWKLTSCTTNSIGYKIYSNPYISWSTSLLRLSFLPMRSHGSSFNVIVFDDLAPLIFPLFPHLRFLVLERKLKVHTKMLTWPFPFKISYACIAFQLFYILCRPFQYISRQYPTLHPTTYLHFFPPLTMPWVLPKTKYFVY
jgi:hypothetical protein